MESPAAELIFDRRPPDAKPLVSFLVPVYNERAHVLPVLEALARLPVAKEVLVVDDGSTDGTRDLLAAHRGADTALLFHARNAGKGAAVRTALARARGRYVAIQDADLEYDPREYLTLLDELRSRNLRAVYGSRFLTDNPNLYKRYLLGNKTLTAFLNLLCGARYTDSYTCYKLMEREVMESLDLTSRGFELEAEISVKLAMRRVPLAEHPIRYNPRRIEEGKKINSRDALKGVTTILRLWWAERRRAGTLNG